MPSPQALTVQMLVQLSLVLSLPSSHCSPTCTTPSPHLLSVSRTTTCDSPHDARNPTKTNLQCAAYAPSPATIDVVEHRALSTCWEGGGAGRGVVLSLAVAASFSTALGWGISPARSADEPAKAPGYEPPASKPEHRTRPYDKAAGGLGAVTSVLKEAGRHTGMVRGMQLLARINQPNGFDCPGCAWPDPPAGERTAFEFCENGAKAAMAEGTKRRVTPTFSSSTRSRTCSGAPTTGSRRKGG